jgi:hypothetical protein
VYFLHDVPPEVAAEGEPYQRPEADVVFGSVCDFSAWPPGINPDVLPGGHLIALSQPARLAGYLLGV